MDASIFGVGRWTSRRPNVPVLAYRSASTYSVTSDAFGRLNGRHVFYAGTSTNEQIVDIPTDRNLRRNNMSMLILTRIRNLFDDGTVHECRHCGTVLESGREDCPLCGRSEIATYEIG